MTIRPHVVAVLCALALAPGCSVKRLRELDGGAAAPDGDPAPSVDAHAPWIDAAPGERDGGAPPPSRGAFHVRDTVTPEIQPPPCPQRVGWIAWDVSIPTESTCQEAGPVVAWLDPSTRIVYVDAWVWEVRGVPCEPRVADVKRTVRIRISEPGPYTLVARDLRVPFDVAPSPPDACRAVLLPPGAVCGGDCECEMGLVCATAGNVCERQCQPPCEVVGEPSSFCRPDEQCDATELGSRCGPRLTSDCAPDRPCRDGQRCVAEMPAVCLWEIPGALPPRACRTDDDCEPGRDCVGWMGEDPTLRRCQIRCTSSDMRCPDGTSGHCAEQGTCDPIGL